MHRRIIILILTVALLLLIAYKQNWYPFAVDKAESAKQTSLAVNAEMQNAFDAGQAVWLVFSSDTCPACIELEKLAAPVMVDYQEKVAFIRVDVNNAENQEMLGQYPVSYIPASFIYDKTGNLSFSTVGVMQPDEIRSELDKVVSI